MDRCYLCQSTKTLPLLRWKVERHLDMLGLSKTEVSFAACGDCGLARQHPVLPIDVIQRLYTELNIEAKLTDFDERCQWFLRAAGNDVPPGRVLDVGCSEGKQLLCYKELGWEIEGIEPSTEAARKAEANGVFIHNCSIDDAMLEPQRFDLIIFFHLLEHLPDPSDFLAKMWDALRDGGYLYFEVPNQERPYGNLENFFPATHQYIFAPCHIETLLESFEARVVRCEPTLNQRWLVQKANGSRIEKECAPVNVKELMQKVKTQTFSLRIASFLKTMSAEGDDYRPTVDLPPPGLNYIVSVQRFIADWGGKWQAETKDQPAEAVKRMLEMLYGRLDIFYMIQVIGVQTLNEKSLFYYGKLLTYPQHYSDSAYDITPAERDAILHEIPAYLSLLLDMLNRLLPAR